jgi:hypothetical protein
MPNRISAFDAVHYSFLFLKNSIACEIIEV